MCIQHTNQLRYKRKTNMNYNLPISIPIQYNELLFYYHHCSLFVPLLHTNSCDDPIVKHVLLVWSILIRCFDCLTNTTSQFQQQPHIHPKIHLHSQQTKTLNRNRYHTLDILNRSTSLNLKSSFVSTL